jgi:hypothetical protein
LAHFQNKAANPFSLSLVANPCHHGRWFSALFSVAALLAAHIAFGDAFSAEKNKHEHRPTHGQCP